MPSSAALPDPVIIEVGIFAVSTYNTDYVLVKEKDFRKALGALKSAGYRILDLETGTDKDGEE